MTSSQRVAALRAVMANYHYHAFVIPSEDAHMSEYVAACDERRAFISGFDGSAGTALVTMDAAYCWTDGRYFVQAAKQLDPQVYTMMKVHEDPSIEEWLAKNLPPGSKVAIDGKTVSINTMNRFNDAISSSDLSPSISLVTLPNDVPNLVDQVWSSARPAHPAATIVVHSTKQAGTSVQAKLKLLRTKMASKDASMLIVSALDEIAWLLNLRGADVDYNPVFWAYVTLTQSQTTLYVNETRFSDEVADHLKQNDVTVMPYDALLSDLAQKSWDDSSRVWMDPNNCNYAILHTLETADGDIQTIKKQGPISLAKAKKNDVELDGMRASHVRDGVALAKFLCWLENEVVNLGHTPSECEAADKLDGLRSEQEMFVSLSFPTISSSGSNAAVIHYRPERETCMNITTDRVYLVDSGAQYKDGTTDVTRTMHFGTPTAWQKECFTRVLQGHIAIDTLIFPKGTTGHVLDGFARQALWKVGLDYKHGTGHGVGSHLNVHEGPHVISFKDQALGTALEPGFITSNEPGYYEEDKFGIRIENLCIIVEADVKGPPGGKEKPFYGMEHVTFSPIQANMIDVSLLSNSDREWIDNYHKECFAKLSPLLQDDSETLAWLQRNTAALS